MRKAWPKEFGLCLQLCEFHDISIESPFLSTATMSLLQDVLRSKTEDIERRLNNVRITRRSAHLDVDDSDDEIVNVVRPNI